MRRAVIVSALLLAACGSGKKQAQLAAGSSSVAQSAAAEHKSPAKVTVEESQDAQEPGDYTSITARHVIFREASGLQLRAEWLRGKMYPTQPGVLPSLDDPASFKVEVLQGKMMISIRVLAEFLNASAFKDSKLTNIRLSAPSPHEIQINATAHRLVPLPIQLNGTIEATPDGRIGIQIKKLEVLKIPFKGLLHVMNLSASNLVQAPNSGGIQIHGNTIYFRTDHLLPPPRQLGKVSAVHFTQDGYLVEEYGGGKAQRSSGEDLENQKWHNYVRLNSGTVRFGKLTMHQTDLVLIDTSPGDWLEFDLPNYRDQLAAGEMRMAKSGGLLVYIPDLSKLTKAREVETTSPTSN